MRHLVTLATATLLAFATACEPMLAREDVAPEDPAGSYESALSATADTSSSYAWTSSPVLARPTALVDGDLIVAALQTRGARSIIAAPAGFTQLPGSPITTSGGAYGDVKLYVFTKVARQEPAIFQFTQDRTQHVWGALISFHGADAVSPIFSRDAAVRANATSLTLPSVSSPSNASQLVTIFAARNLTASPFGRFSTPSAMAAREQVNNNYGGLLLATQSQSGLGHTGTKSASYSTASDLAGIILVVGAASGDVSTPTPTPTPVPVGAENEIRFPGAYTTSYNWWDNNPAQSSAISNPVIHSQAGGTGTFADPITVAVDDVSPGTLQFKPGTKFYVPNIRAYLIVEDRTGEIAPTSGNRPHFDIWSDGRTSTQQNAYNCMSHLTDGNAPSHLVIQNPASNYAVVVGALATNNTCRTLYGDALIVVGGGSTSVVDAGSAGVDAGVSAVDAGVAVKDAGVVGRDAGTAVVDAGSITPTPSTSAKPPSSGYFSTLPVGATLPSGAECAARVHRSSWEPRPQNNTANHTVPTALQLASFHAGQPDAYNARVDGNFTGTTDEIIQWASCKWGFADNIFRAEGIIESGWDQAATGDFTTNFADCPADAVKANGGCYQSYGFLQDKWKYHKPAYPMYRTMTAFELDYALAQDRQCFDTHAGNIEGCLGMWWSGTFEINAYVSRWRTEYNAQNWLKSGF